MQSCIKMINVHVLKITITFYIILPDLYCTHYRSWVYSIYTQYDVHMYSRIPSYKV